MNAVTLGLQLTRLRQEAGLTQAQLAQRMGTSQPAISKIESGRTLPTIKLLDRLARVTGKPIELVLDGELGGSLTREEIARRAKKALAGYQFNPWERSPSNAEAKSLIADGLTPERFQSAAPAPRSRS